MSPDDSNTQFNFVSNKNGWARKSTYLTYSVKMSRRALRKCVSKNVFNFTIISDTNVSLKGMLIIFRSLLVNTMKWAMERPVQ